MSVAALVCAVVVWAAVVAVVAGVCASAAAGDRALSRSLSGTYRRPRLRRMRFGPFDSPPRRLAPKERA
jgi:hypothetical protein